MHFPRSRIVPVLVVALAALLHSAALAAPPARIPNEILVKFRPTANASDRALVRSSVNARALHDFSFINVEHMAVRGMTTDQAIERLRNNPHVVYAEPNYEITVNLTPNDPRFPEMYGLHNTGQSGGTAGDDIKAVEAWNLYTGDPNLLVGVIDTGVDYNHPDLAANIWTNPGEIPGNGIDDDGNGYIDDVHGYDFYNNDGDPFDDYGHGTHVSGTIAAAGNNNTGVVGVCWGAKIVAIKFLGSTGSGSTAGAIAGVQYAIRVGVRLTSNSWGGGGFSQALLDAINAAGAAGQLFVAAAGNSSANTDQSPSYPASYDSPYIISVAATDRNDALAYFSNYGATTVDLAAPGVDILSTLPGNSYGTLSGTSMATPHVSGVVALTWGRYPAVSNLQVKNMILGAVDTRAGLAGKCVTGGRLNAFMTIAEPDDTPPGMIADLSASNPGSNTMGLAWTATGDDGSTGRASRYEIRYSTSPIDESSFSSATLAEGPDPKPAGSAETFTVLGLSFSTPYYFAIKAFDEFNNAGPISNIATGTTLGAPLVSVTPPSLSADLLTGAAVTQTLTVRNDGAGTLDFTVPTPELMFSQPVVHPYEPYVKEEGDWRVGPPVAESKGGPDGYGYRWVDSDEPGGPSFSWVDITGLTSPISLTGDEGISAAIPMGMDFPFYGATFNSVRVCTNGFLSFTDAATSYDNQALPNSGAPANLVAPMWDDLDFGSAQRAYAYNDGMRFIVSWVGVPHYQSGGPYTFQAIFYPTGEIRFQYLSLASPTNSATAGIQNGSKSIGLTVAYNATYLKENLAVRVIPLQQWLSVTPTSGRVYAGLGQDLQVRFNALGLSGGGFDGTIHVLSNDPSNPDVARPAHLHVTGAPDLAVQPPSFDFGTVFTGSTNTQNLAVTNPGTDDLVVSGITSDDAFVTATPASFTVHPLQSQTVVVTYHPTAVRTTAATLTVTSNDPDTPVLAVPVAGVSTPAPSFSVTPTTLDVALLTNTATSRNLLVQNTGGSDYIFTAEALTFSPTGTVTVGSDADNVFVEKGQPDVVAGPAPARTGGPDVFGYTYMDSDESGGPTFSWVDITTTGTQVNMTGDDVNSGYLPLGFSFPFYGKTFSQFRICTNGWVSFSSAATTYSNTTLPNTGSTVPENLLAVFWDDLNFSSVKRAYYQYDGSRLIIEYLNVPVYGQTSTNTFEILLYPNGTIVYQYLTMGTPKNSCTIGIQNEAKNDGLQVVYNNDYVKNNLAIRFRPPARFLTVSPISGTVPAGRSMNLTVGFNAADLFGGVYNGAVRIRGNDPVLPQQDVTCALTVTGVPDVAANPTLVEFGNVFVGFPAVRQLTVQNRGTDVLHVTGITPSNGAYGVDMSVFDVPALGSAIVTVALNPPGPGAYPATLTIASNDPDTPSLAVDLNGAGLIPPDVVTDPASLSATLPIPTSQVQTLTIENRGGSDLNYVVGTVLKPASVAVYDPLLLGKEETDPRPGIRGTGGPDAFGYTWRDSDEPGGPGFDWVDITTIGTLLPLTGDDANQAGVPIGFEFPFYGTNFNTVNVCTNGWLSFTSTSTSLGNQQLPNSGAPENLLAAFWDDLNPGSTQRIYRYGDGTRFILSYVAVPRYSSGGPYTFQVILYPTGRIVYQYLDMQGTRLNEATVGIQNAAKNDGLTVVFDAAYVHNNLAVEFRTLPDWMTAAPTTGTIPPGGSAPVQVTFNTLDLFGGAYHGDLRITSNDPRRGVLLVPSMLTAIGTPDVAVDPANLDFGWLYVSQHRDLPLTIRNGGSDVLTVTGLTIGSPSFELADPPALPITLGNRGSVTVVARFRPPSPCVQGSPCTATLVITSNDPDEGSFAVPLQGVALVPPEAEVAPTSHRAALATTLGPKALTRTKTLRLSNSGGSDLDWTAEALCALPAAVDMTPSAEQGKNDPGQAGTVTPLAAGGPDAYGYRYADSDDPAQVPPFEWIDITGTGTAIPFNADDQNLGPFPLPFPFPFYGNTFTEFRACTNGWISFTHSLSAMFTNTTLPNGTAPENLIAPFWDDLTFSTSGHAYYYYDGSKFIIEYAAVPHYSSGGPYTFEIILYPSGTIDFQYLDMPSRLNEATLGIQNATKDVGLQVAYNADYVKNALRVRFSRQPGWLSVAPASGKVPAGAGTDLAVGFDATGLADGDHSGVIRIASNDLTDPVIDVPVNLHVGTVPVSFDLDPNSLNRASNGNWLTGLVEPMSGYDPHDIRTSSVWLQRSVPVVPNAPLSYGDKDLDGLTEAGYKFSRPALSALLPEGNAVPVEVIGEFEDVTWFSGTDMIRVLKPHMTITAGLGEIGKESTQKQYSSGSTLQLAWDDPAGYVPDYYDLWFSADGGESWTLVTGHIASHSATWQVPVLPTTTGLLEVVAMDSEGIMGSWISDMFDIIASPTGVGDEEALPKVLSLRFRGQNPLPADGARFELALPAASRVTMRVYDVRGALVREIVPSRALPAGRHGIQWDGRNQAGTPVGSGVYFVRAAAGGKLFNLRVAVVR